MARTTIGLDIGTSAVRAAQVKGKDPATLVGYAQLPLPPGSMKDGEIVDADAVAAVIRDLWRRGEFRGKKVALAVANPSVVVREVDVPRMEESDLRGALRYQVQDYIPIAIEEALLDFLPLEEFVTGDGVEMMRVLAVAAHRDMVNAFVGVLARAGLEPTSIDLGPLAAVRALTEAVPAVLSEYECEAIVDIGAGVTSMVVHERGAPQFVRILAEGGADLTEALASALGVSADEAEERKMSVEAAPEGAPIEPGTPAAVERRVRSFVDDVQRSLEYYASERDRTPVRRVLLTGGGALLGGLQGRLAGALGLPVERGDALGRVKVGDLGLASEQIQRVAAVGAVAVGLALES